MPLQLLGVVASGVEVASTSFESIATITVGSGGAANVEFTSIPGTYTHLQLRAICRTERTIVGDTIYVTINSDTTKANYARHILYVDGSSATAVGTTSNSDIGTTPGSSANANVFSANVIDILDYANTNKYKTIRYLAGYDNNGSGQVRIGSTLWQSTSAITSIKIDNDSGNDINQYSHFALYGIKSA